MPGAPNIHRGDAENAEEKHAEEKQSQNLRARRGQRKRELAPA
jgi:hypothetical protein